MFAKWLEKEMDMGNTEAQLIITKSKSAEIKSGYEELTVKEMVKKGFSAHPVCISRQPPTARNTVLYSSSKDKDREHRQKGWNP